MSAALVLVGLGVRHLSMTPSSISTVKRATRSVALTDLEHDARASPTEASAESVRARFDLLESL